MSSLEAKNNKFLFSVDIAKFICAIAVIGIHTQMFSNFGELANYFTFGVLFRVAVAFFFVCSGFFFFGKLEFSNGKIKKSAHNRRKLTSYLTRLIILYIIWSVIYFILQLIQWVTYPDITFIHLLIGFAKSFIVDGSYYHLWYILCLIYSVPIIYVLLRRINLKNVMLIAIFLYALHLIINFNGICEALPVVSVIGKLSLIPGAIGQTLFIAIPLVTAGGYVAIKKCEIKKLNSNILFVLSLLLLVAEASLIFSFSGKTDHSAYIIFTFVASVIGFLAVKNIDLSSKNKERFHYFRNMSTVMYCIHPLVIELLKLIVSKERINSLIWFFIIMIPTIVISYLFVFISNKVKLLKYFY